MLKKLFVVAIAGLMLCITPLSNAVADCRSDSIIFGLSGNNIVASANFANKGSFDGNKFDNGETYIGRSGYGVLAYIGSEFLPDIVFGIEGGLKDADFVIKKLSYVPYQTIETEIFYAAVRVDKYINFDNDFFDVFFGIYAGMSNVDFFGTFYNGSKNLIFSEDFKNFITGARVGATYNFTENAGLFINYLFSFLPGAKKQEISSRSGEKIRFSDFKYKTHAIELGMKMTFQFFD